MRIIGLDPGPTESAFVELVDGACVSFDKRENKRILDVLWLSTPDDVLVIEQIASFGMPVGAEVFETVFWSGRFAQHWTAKWERIKRHEVKMHLCHNMKAKDGNIRQALIDRYGKPGTKKNKGATYGISGDCWSALAVATVYADRIQSEPRKEP